MKLWTLATLSAALLITLSGCGAKPVPKKQPLIDDTLPTVVLTKNGTIADINSIALEWEAINDQRVKGIYIYRVALDSKSDGKNEYYDTVSSRFATHYLDRKIEPNSRYSYYFKTYSADAESRKSEATTIASLPPMESVSWIHSIQNMPRSAKIIWRPHVNEKVKAYIIQRKTLQQSEWIDIVTIQGRLNAEYIDKNLKDKHIYKYRVRALTFDNIISNPSQEVSVITKKLPTELTQVRASTDLPRRIKIDWEQSDIGDFSTYRVYKSSNINGSYNTLADTKSNTYTDVIEEDGKEYFYRVSVFDKDGLESINNNHTVLGKTLMKPSVPSMVEAKLRDGRVHISWYNTDSRVKSYVIQKRYQKSLFESKVDTFENIRALEFVDSEIEIKKVYFYKIFAVDANGIKSEPSIEAQVKVDESVMVNSTPVKEERIIQQQPAVVDIPSSSEPKEDLIVPMQDFN